MPEKYSISAEEEEAEGQRLDLFLTHYFLSKFSRSYIQKLIRSEEVLVSEKIVKPNYILKTDDDILINVPDPIAYDVIAEDIPLDIVYEDEDLCVINKSVGMVVHPACGHYTGTLVHALLYHCSSLSGMNGVLRPGIVHRLDKDTSGLMVVAKNDQAHRHLAEQLQDRSLKRSYWTIAKGVFPNETLKCETQIARSRSNRKLMAVVQEGGKEAISNFAIKERFEKHTLLEVSLCTGRTHQIRVHLKYLGYPVVGDPVYSREKNVRLGTTTMPFVRQALHAKEIAFIHPKTRELKKFETDLPEDMQKLLTFLREGALK